MDKATRIKSNVVIRLLYRLFLALHVIEIIKLYL